MDRSQLTVTSFNHLRQEHLYSVKNIMDNIDITEYFKEFYNKDVSDIANNIESLSLKEDDSFDDFNKAEVYIHRFSDSKGFKI
ncbi:25019_t:CDS:2 [Cetraspora pellucida]|uniref:25019_t:CDS:1 n=1 Tax=Cetraspora pellucida TaxID=1433469 RepID=A0A9N9FHV1_9GLOM|nr:25019_t:CDS:2 [Cetraspora pellucida]